MEIEIPKLKLAREQLQSFEVNDIAPVCLFVYNRPENVIKVIESLTKNPLAQNTDLYIFSDGPATSVDHENVSAVRKIISNISGFRSVVITESPVNRGLAASVIDGTSKVLQHSDNVIVLEDDLIVSNNYLDFINGALRAYESRKDVFSISGYSFPIKTHKKIDVYFTRRGCSWGWATWKNRWEEIDWEIKDFNHFKQNSKLQQDFNNMGSDLSNMLKKQMDRKIDSWAIRWNYHQFKNRLFTVYPVHSKVINTGFNGQSTHTKTFQQSRFSTTLDHSNQKYFEFRNPILEKEILNQFLSKFSFRTRLYYKIKEVFNF
jgi:hypothetical protein